MGGRDDGDRVGDGAARPSRSGRAQDLAKALRENLKRRKAQARARAAEPEDATPGDSAPGDEAGAGRGTGAADEGDGHG